MSRKPRLLFFAAQFAEYSTRMVEALAPHAEILFVLSRDSRLGQCDPAWFRRATAGVRLVEFRTKRRPLLWLATPFVLARCLLFRPDVIHLQERPDLLSTLVGLLLTRRTPLVLTVHDPQTHRGRDTALCNASRFQRRDAVRRAADLFHVHGAYCRRQLVEMVGAGRPVVSTCHGVIQAPLPDERRSAEPGRILFFGRMEEYKGADVLIEAFERLNARGRDYTLVLAGEGPALDKARAERTRGVIVINRFISRAEAAEQFQRASLVALPYLEATQSGVAAAAIANGRAMVASAVGGLRDVVRPGLNGVLVPPGDPGELAEAIDRVFQQPGLLEQLSSGSAQSQEELSWTKVGAAVAGAYDALLRSRPSPARTPDVRAVLSPARIRRRASEQEEEVTRAHVGPT